MFKKLSFKKFVKRYLSKTRVPSTHKIVTVRVLVDGVNFKDSEKLVEALLKNGFKRENIRVLVFSQHQGINTSNITYFLDKEINLSGKTTNGEVNFFFENRIDLLINYYKDNNLTLLYMSAMANADFNVGFVMSEERLNHLSIDVQLSDYELFVSEMVKYLKTFNKI